MVSKQQQQQQQQLQHQYQDQHHIEHHRSSHSIIAKSLIAAYEGIALTVAVYAIAHLFAKWGDPSAAVDLSLPSVWIRLLFDVMLCVAFGVQHSVMARDHFKKYVYNPFGDAAAAVDRSSFVLMAGIALYTVVRFWQPIVLSSSSSSSSNTNTSVNINEEPSMSNRDPSSSFNGILFSLGTAGDPSSWIAVTLVHTLFACGAVLFWLSAWAIAPMHLFGMQQAWDYIQDRPSQKDEDIPLITNGLYRILRHPLMMGILVMAWSTTVMTVDRFLLALAATVYICIGTSLEEQQMSRTVPGYLAYTANTPWVLPIILPRNAYQYQTKHINISNGDDDHDEKKTSYSEHEDHSFAKQHRRSA